MHHDLKQFVDQFQDIVDCKKRSIVRLNDREYKVADTITLWEGQPGIDGYEYTMRSISARISYIDNFGCQDGYVNLSLASVGMLVVRDEVPK